MKNGVLGNLTSREVKDSPSSRLLLISHRPGHSMTKRPKNLTKTSSSPAVDFYSPYHPDKKKKILIENLTKETLKQVTRHPEIETRKTKLVSGTYFRS